MAYSHEPEQSVKPGRLIIVYNADEGWPSALRDAARKLVRPETYPCSLCRISYGALSMRKAWRQYLDGLGLETHFYHRQDFARAYPGELFSIAENLSLPAIFFETRGELHPLLSSQQLDSLSNVGDMVAAMDLALERFIR